MILNPPVGKTRLKEILKIVSSWGESVILYFTTFIAGCSIMILEIAGTRIINPFYGVSIYVWVALISVTLLSLAMGYFLGGLIADRLRSLSYLYILFFLAAIFIFFLPQIAIPILLWTNKFGLQSGSIVSSFLIFAFPLTVLAMSCPFIIRSLSHDLKNIGFLSGGLYALSTLGSLCGTFMTIVLLAHFSLPQIFQLVSVILWALVLIFFLISKRKMALLLWTATIIVLVFISPFQSSSCDILFHNRFNSLFSEAGFYGHIRVLDEEPSKIRWLLSDASNLGAISRSDGRFIHRFLKYYEVLPWLNPQGKTALQIGLGVGAAAYILKSYNIITDIVEIDPKILEAAKSFFNFEPTGEVTIGDGRYFLRRISKKYDFVIHDTFTGGVVPYHLLTIETFETIKKKLNEKGILALVFVGLPDSKASKSVFLTLNNVFSHVRVFNDGEDNLFFLASDDSLQWAYETIPLPERAILSELLKGEIVYRDLRGTVVIRDDFNPIDIFQREKAKQYQKYFTKYFMKR